MTERVLRGMAASPGVAIGRACMLDAVPPPNAAAIDEGKRQGEAALAFEALEAAGRQISQVASELAARGNAAEAEIVETGALMAGDPGLVASVRASIIEDGADAVSALLGSTEVYAEALAAVGDPVLALRADDVRSLGRRAARLAAGSSTERPSDCVLVARDLGPADVAELGNGVRAIALAAGGVMAHAAIVARSLGIPTVVGLGDAILDVGDDSPLVVDGAEGVVTVAPGREQRHRAHIAAAQRQRARERSAATRGLPSVTLDGHAVRILANVASSAEVSAGLGAGAEGVGLFRTELRFLDARAWPVEEQHRRHMAPVLAPLSGLVTTVRLLDFGGDKTPPFLRGTTERGIGLLLANPNALREQLRAVVDVGAHSDLRVLLPMVETRDQVDTVRAELDSIPGGASVALGAMIETAEAVRQAPAIAAAADFLSIGTNDLTHSVLGTDRFAPGEAAPHHPGVLIHIGAVVAAAGGAGRIVEVCGEAAGDPVTMPILVGLGVDELSVGAARVGLVRAWVRALAYADAQALAKQALALELAAEVAEAAAPTRRLLAELDDTDAEGVESSTGVVTLGGQP